MDELGLASGYDRKRKTKEVDVAKLAKADEAGLKEKDEAADVYEQISDEEWSRHKQSGSNPPGQPPTQQ